MFMYLFALQLRHSLSNYCLQGFSVQNLITNEVAAITSRCEQRLGHAIPEEDLIAGKLGQYLCPEDYQPIKDVSNCSITLLC